MNFLRIAWRDIKSILRNKFIRVAVIAVIVIPLLYSLLYLAAFWDPYSRLQDVPVAVVNLDKGSTKDNKAVNYGQDLVNKLKADDQLGWRFVTKEDGENGVKGSKYYAEFVIPENFSEKVLSAKNGKPQQPSIIFSDNEQRNFLAAQINGKVEIQLKANIVKTITNEYATAAFDSLYDVKDGLNTAANGSKDLKDGISTARDGSNQIKDGIGQIKNKIPDLASGIQKLVNGSNEMTSGINSIAVDANGNPLGLKNGASQLAAGLDSAKQGAATLNNGISQVQSGVGQAGSGIQSLNTAVNVGNTSKGIPSLVAGMSSVNSSVTTQLSPGVAALNSAVNTYVDAAHPGLGNAVKSLNDNVNQLNTLVAAYNSTSDPAAKQNYLNTILAAIPQLQAGTSGLNTAVNVGTDAAHPALTAAIAGLNTAVNVGTDAAHPALTTALASLNAGTQSLGTGVAQLNTAVNVGSGSTPSLVSGVSSLSKGSNQLLTGMNKLSNGFSGLLTGINSLADGSSQLTNGLNTLNSSVPQLTDGTNKLYDGSSSLSDGMNKLYDGSDKLYSGLNDGAVKINKNLINSSKDMGNFISNPLSITDQPVNPVKNYGTGFAPYFIPLSLWVGAIMMFFVITDKVDDDIKANSLSLVLGKYISYGFVGTMQAVLVSTVVLFLGLHPTNIVLYYLVNIFMSFAFIAIIQCLVFLLGLAGRAISIILLIFQLTACAGTFPLEVVPTFFKVLNPYMPFTYCVSALREVISATSLDYTILARDFSVLAGILAAALIISVLFKGHADKMQEIIKEKKENLNIA